VKRTRGARKRGIAALLLAATLASLVATIASGYLTRLSLIEATWWVTHTEEVKLAIDECERALDHDDAEALKSAEAKVQRLTVDNPTQRSNVARAGLLTERRSRAALEDLFVAMQGEEDRLMTLRTQRIASARAKSSAAFVAGAALTLAFGVGAFALLQAQRRELARQRTLLETILESVDEGIIAVDASHELVAINRVARSMWGGSAPRDQWPKDWSATLQATYEDGSVMKPAEGPLARALRGEGSEGVVYRIVLASERATENAGTWVSASACPIRDESGRTIAAVATLRDITEQRAYAERLRDQSLTDELTGLLNRRGFHAMANARIAEARRSKLPMALFYADVDGLKRVNDELGHEQGDQVIQDAARTLRDVFRGGDIVARIGGDEFVALLPNFSPAASGPLLERLATAIGAHSQQPRPFRLSMSCGLTFMDWDRGRSLDELLADADRTMYERKRAGKSSPVLQAVPPSGAS
jgi:diguanylate cyclase (GGDEF)-like protein